MLKKWIDKIKEWFAQEDQPVSEPGEDTVDESSTDNPRRERDDRHVPSAIEQAGAYIAKYAIQRTVEDFNIIKTGSGGTLDAPDILKPSLTTLGVDSTPANPLLMEWYVSQGFIGYQNCAIIAQHWLIDRCCTLPVKDAVRDGYFLTRSDGEELDPEVAQQIIDIDNKFNINNQMIQFYKKGAIFGIRIALFKVRSKDKKYYEKPFNIDGVTPGSYQGIVQIDPYWITPELDISAAGDPTAIDFYEPTYWRMDDQLYHKSHLIITRYAEVCDILKPTYLYGGIPLTQMLYELVYNYARIANEIPILVESKRLYVAYIDVKDAFANPRKFEERQNLLNNFKNNYGTFYLDHEDKMEKFDTSLTDLSNSLETAASLVAAASRIVETVLFSKAITGLNNKGDGDNRNYIDTVEDARRRILPLLDRHHELVIRSYIDPELSKDLKIQSVWNEIETVNDDSMAEMNLKKATTDEKYITMGVLSAEESRTRVAKDKESGYELEVENESLPEMLGAKIDLEDLDITESQINPDSDE